MNIFKVYAQMKDYDEETDELAGLKADGRYCLLEVVSEWYGDKNKGLAAYLNDNEDLGKALKSIQYKCFANYVEFTVCLNKGFEADTKIKYRDKEKTVFEAACNYISGQISDGWGENGIYIIDGGWMGDPARCVSCDCELYERDYAESKRLAKENGEDYADFDEYPAFKKVEISFKKIEL